MKLITPNKLAQSADTPAIRTLRLLCSKKPRPSYVHKKGGILHIDIKDEEWLTYLSAYRRTALNTAKKKLKKDMGKLEETPKQPKTQKTLKIQELEEKVRGQRIKNDISTLKLKKSEGLVISADLAEFLFFGFLDKCATDMLRLGKKIGRKVDILVTNGDADGILKLISQEMTVILQETKKQQKKDVEQWVKENGGMVDD